MTPLDVMWVGLGGGVGSLLRWLTGRVIGWHYHGDFPVGTFLINVSGAFAIGHLSVLFKVDWRDRYGTALNAGVLMGVLGGYTTFSSMQLDAVKLAGKKARFSAQTLVLPPFLTSRGDIPMTVRVMRAGAVNFFTKPVEADDLTAAIRCWPVGRDDV
jgi:CrcB protein